MDRKGLEPVLGYCLLLSCLYFLASLFSMVHSTWASDLTLKSFLSKSPVTCIYHIPCQASKPTVLEFSVRTTTADHISFLKAPVPIKKCGMTSLQHHRLFLYTPPFLLSPTSPHSRSHSGPLLIQDQIYISGLTSSLQLQILMLSSTPRLKNLRNTLSLTLNFQNRIPDIFPQTCSSSHLLRHSK